MMIAINPFRMRSDPSSVLIAACTYPTADW
jgi:hypothetical protein